MLFRSGLAIGIDGISHKAAIDAKGKTIAVIGSGIDSDYPQQNLSIRKEIINGNGAVITEFMPGIAPSGFNFPMRNRIISGLSAGVVVIEAKEKSGTLITAGHALSQDRDVFAVPGSIYIETCKGSNMLIKQGAKLITSGKDILEEYSLFHNYILTEKYNKFTEKEDIPEQTAIENFKLDKKIKLKAPPPYLNEQQKLIYNELQICEKSPEEICLSTDLPIHIVLAALTQLEIFGAITTETGKKFKVQN